MSSKLERILETAFEDFLNSYLYKLPEVVPYSVTRVDGIKKGSISRESLISKFHVLVSKNVGCFKSTFIDHIAKMESYIAYSSTPKAFEQAWKFRKTKISNLSLFEVQGLIAQQAQLIPMIKSENLLNAGEKGLIKSKENGAFLYGVRHSKGNYDDTLDELGNFSYQPPFDALGMLRYRLLEYLTVKFELPIFMYSTMWFKHEALESTNHVTMICPLTITKLNSQFDSHLNLQLITIDQAIEKSMMLRSLDTVDSKSKIRTSLPIEHVIKYNYESIKNNKKLRNNIINWAIKKGKKCPGSKCQSIEFRKLSNRAQIHLGHIVPQSWGSLFQYFQENSQIHHPDNLYLSCSTCNISLNASFPDDNLRNNIINDEFGTIGDYIRSDIHYFSNVDE